MEARPNGDGEMFHKLLPNLALERRNHCRSVMNELPGEATHKHKCDRCDFVWRHTEACVGDHAAHTCAKCGATDQRWRYRGLDEPTELL